MSGQAEYRGGIGYERIAAFSSSNALAFSDGTKVAEGSESSPSYYE
jgi:hypothetical protein